MPRRDVTDWTNEDAEEFCRERGGRFVRLHDESIEVVWGDGGDDE